MRAAMYAGAKRVRGLAPPPLSSAAEAGLELDVIFEPHRVSGDETAPRWRHTYSRLDAGSNRVRLRCERRETGLL